MSTPFTISGVEAASGGTFTISGPGEPGDAQRTPAGAKAQAMGSESSEGDMVELSERGKSLAASMHATNAEAASEEEAESVDPKKEMLTSIEKQLEKLQEQMEQVQEEIEEMENSKMDDESKKQMVAMKRQEIAQIQAQIREMLDQKEKIMKEDSLTDVTPHSLRGLAG